jgi:hypothetical protein
VSVEGQAGTVASQALRDVSRGIPVPRTVFLRIRIRVHIENKVNEKIITTVQEANYKTTKSCLGRVEALKTRQDQCCGTVMIYSGRGKFMPLPLKSKILETPGFLVTDYIKMFPL